MRPLVSHPSLAMACNAYRRLHGQWPEAARFAPGYFASIATDMSTGQLILLATVFDVTVSVRERSPRVTVSGVHGALTYDHGVQAADYDEAPFDEWLRSEAQRLEIDLSAE